MRKLVLRIVRFGLIGGIGLGADFGVVNPLHSGQRTQRRPHSVVSSSGRDCSD